MHWSGSVAMEWHRDAKPSGHLTNGMATTWARLLCFSVEVRPPYARPPLGECRAALKGMMAENKELAEVAERILEVAIYGRLRAVSPAPPAPTPSSPGSCRASARDVYVYLCTHTNMCTLRYCPISPSKSRECARMLPMWRP